MSVMSELAMEIEDMLIDGEDPQVIARCLGLSMSMVYDVLETMDQPAEEYNPFDTVNS